MEAGEAAEVGEANENKGAREALVQTKVERLGRLMKIQGVQR